MCAYTNYTSNYTSHNINNDSNNDSDYNIDINNDFDSIIVLNYINKYIDSSNSRNIINSIIRKFINKGGNIDDILATSCRLDYFEVGRIMIDYGADVNSNNNDPLMWCALNNSTNMIKLLIDNGANVNACNGLSFVWVIQNGNIDVVKYFIENGADINLNHNMYLETAIQNNHMDILEYLLSIGGNLMQLDKKLQERVKILDYKWEKPPKHIKFRETNECPITCIEFNNENIYVEKLGCSKCLNVFERNGLEKWFVYNSVCPFKCKESKFYLL